MYLSINTALNIEENAMYANKNIENQLPERTIKIFVPKTSFNIIASNARLRLNKETTTNKEFGLMFNLAQRLAYIES